MGFFSSVWGGIKDAGGAVAGGIGDIWDNVTSDILKNMADPFSIWGVNNNGWMEQGWTAFKHLIIPDMRRDREVMANTSTTARRIIYGRTRASGQLAYAETAGGANENFHVVIIFAGHAIDGYEEIWFDDKKAATVSSGVVTMLAPFAGIATAELFDGTQTTACANLVAASAGNWTADHKLLGCAYGYFKLTYSEGSYPSGLPNIKAVLRGKRVHDPRNLTTAWSDNPFLCLRDYMLLGEEFGGMGCASDEVDGGLLVESANIADQVVSINGTGGTEKRYTLNGVINLDSTPSGIIKDMLTSCAGIGVYTGAEWRLYAGAPATPVASLDESWLNGGISFKVGGNKNDLINTVKGTFVNASEYWENTEFPIVTSAAYLTEDADEELTADISLPFTTSPSMAQRLAKIVMEKSRRGFSMPYPCNMKAFQLDVWDAVAINNTQLGFNAKPFRIASWGFGAMSGVDLLLTEDDEDIYDWGAGYPTYVESSAPLVLPDPNFLAAPTGVEGVPTITDLYGGAVSRVDLLIYWTAGGPGAVRYQVQYQLSGGDWQSAPDTTNTSISILGLASGTYNLRVRAINSLGVPSEWAARNGVVLADNDGEPLAAVTGFTASFVGNMVKLTWDSSSEPDRAYYEIRQGSTWNTAAVVHTRETSTEWSFRPTGSGATTYLIKTFDTAGNESLSAASVVVTVPVAAPPTALTTAGVMFGIEVTVTYPNTLDIDYCEIWASLTNDRTAAVQAGVTRDGKFRHEGLGNAATRYYWARTVNVFGESSAWYPVSATGGVLGSTVVDPSEVIKLLNTQVNETRLTDYLSGTGSFSDVLDTYTPAAQPGVGQTGVFATKGEILIAADKAIQLRVGEADYRSEITLLEGQIQLKASSADLSAQVDILSDAIGLKLNASGTVGPGMLISWTDETHTRSQIDFCSDTFRISKPDGSGVKSIFTVGTVNGASTVGINAGDLIVDGSILARHIAADQLTVGDNVTMGPDAYIAWSNVTSPPSYLQSTKITATTIESPTISAGTFTGSQFILGNGTTYGKIETYDFANRSTGIQIQDGASPSITLKGGTLTGSTFQTATTGDRIVIDGANNKMIFYGNRGDGTTDDVLSIGTPFTDGGRTTYARFGKKTSGYSRTGLQALSYSGAGIVASSVTDVAGVFEGGASLGGYGVILSGYIPLKLVPGGSTTDPGDNGAGHFFVRSDGVLRYHNGTAWKTVQLV